MSNLTWSLGSLAIIISAVVGWFLSKRMASTDNSELEVKLPNAPTSSYTVSTASSTPKTTYTVSSSTTASTAPTEPSKLETFCLAITDFEGGPGDPNHINNNPGDCRCSRVGYLPKYGKVGCSPGGFAVFPTWELGMEYLQNLVHQRAVIHPSWTFLQFFQNYAPSADKNDPDKYASFVAARCGVDKSTTLKSYFV